jgi:A/G-specific adenine glycosylase
MKTGTSRTSAIISKEFTELVWAYYRAHGRHDLPWRKTKDPYKILVSEVMLQQTQVERVIPFYKKFLKQFSTVKALAQAPLADVLKAWQGLGYNRRAKMLHQAAREVIAKHKGKFPHSKSELEKLSGIGPYTAGAVAAFAYNHDVTFIETNIRTAIIQHFFADKPSARSARAEGLSAPKVSDKEILQILEQVFPKGKSREWYSALMDYGAYLKKSGVQLNSKSEHYSKQSKFEGSLRQARGATLRALAVEPLSLARLSDLFDISRRPQIVHAIKALTKEGFVEKNGRTYRLVS